jgi:hypothetical protein
MRRPLTLAALAAALVAGCGRIWLEADGGPIAGTGPHGKYGFVTFEEKGKLWVFRHGSKELADFRAKGEPAKSVTLVGRGPNGMTLRAPDKQTAIDYLYGKVGFVVWTDAENRLWVFRSGSKELADYYAKGELAKHVTRLGAGPGGITIKAPDGETIDAYTAAGVVP